MVSRLPLATLAGLVIATALGAADAPFVDAERLAPELKDKPRQQAAVRRAMAELFGTSPGTAKFPPGAAFPRATAPGSGPARRGPLLYLRHCEHCHGASGDGDGTTAARLFPRPGISARASSSSPPRSRA